MIVPGVGRTVVRCVSVGVAVLVAVGACAAGSRSGSAPPRVTLGPVQAGSTASPSGTPSAAVSSRGVVPTLHVTLPATRPPTLRPALGDLTIRLVSDVCGFYSDTGGGLWLNPTLRAGWSGTGAFPAAGLGFSMKTNYGKATAGGPVSSTNPFTWAIGGEPAVGNSWLGHTVTITVTIDPGNVVAETNESNNVATITVAVPYPLPFSPSGSNGDYTIPCHAA